MDPVAAAEASVWRRSVANSHSCQTTIDAIKRCFQTILRAPALQPAISSRGARRSPLPPGFILPCLPTPANQCKSGPAWVHEIKHDGYRLIARRTSDRVRLYPRGGFNCANRYPRIVEALRSLRVRSIVIDGEAVICGTDGKSDFDKLHSGAHDAHVFLYGFDLIELDGEDLRAAPLEQRKGRLERLLTHSDGIRFSEHLDGDGATIFAHACKLGLEGIVSKRRDLPYRSGRCRAWVKVKNPASPAVLRIQDRDVVAIGLLR
jgi:bifunctional non-homologous end joining protein LigD